LHIAKRAFLALTQTLTIGSPIVEPTKPIEDKNMATDNQNEKPKKSLLKKAAGWAIGIIIGLAILGRLSQGSGSSKSDSSSSSANTSGAADSQTQAQPATQATYKIGDAIVFEDSKWKVLSAENLGSTLTSPLGDKKTEGTFIKVSFSVVNTTKSEDSILETQKILAASGASYQQLDDVNSYLKEGESEMTLEQLPAGLTKNFSAIYEVPKDANGFRFQARSLSGFGTKYTEVQLGF
jgi:hypothetical protein